MRVPNLVVVAQQQKPLSDELVSQVRAFNQHVLGYSDAQPLAVEARGDAGELLGGVSGRTVYQHFLIEVLWVAESERGAGLGRALMAKAEEEARRRGCVGSQVDTLSFQAPGFYQKLGFAVIGEVPNFPPGHTRYFLFKSYLDA